MTDFIEVIFVNGLKMIFLYIPPVDSVYYDEQYVELLCSVFMEADEEKVSVVSMGDLNARLCTLNDISNELSYSVNPDTSTNENGRHLKNILFNSTSAVPLNNLTFNEHTFDGGFTFARNEKQSQIDWCIVNQFSLTNMSEFKIDRKCPAISDHKLITSSVTMDGDKSLNILMKAATELNHNIANHTKVPVINSVNTNLSCLDNLLKTEINKTDVTNMDSHDIAEFLVSNIHRFGKISKVKNLQQRQNMQRMTDVNTDEANVHRLFDKAEQEKWQFVKEHKDSKGLWNAINYKGEINQRQEVELDVDELAEIHSSKSKIDPSQVFLEDISTNKIDEELDKNITEKEINDSVNRLKKSKTSDGVDVSTVKKILPTIMNMLLIFFNLVFKGGATAYPKVWLNFVNAIPKKGRLLPPKFVRFISVMGIFEKIYQNILTARLCTFLKIPCQQTAYQKGKGCNLHVMTIRILKMLTKKTKQKLFIIFTDFEAAFDLVSRRLLFQKLVKMGISAGILKALIAIYIASKSVIEHNNVYSDYVLLLAGVKQGGPPSGLLYIGYTMGLIDVYDNTFHPEPLIALYHFLMHADDILMLATQRSIAIDKVKCLIKFCKENYIRLQITKCAMMCVNSSNDEDLIPFQLENLTLDTTSCEVYLGSAITNSTKVSDDVNADIKQRQSSVIKYFAFLRNNSNAPVDIKLKVLEACISSLLYNAETWCDVKFKRLEVVYRRILKSILGVGMTTCTELLYIELGVLSLKTRVIIKQWNFWMQVIAMSDDPLSHATEKARYYKLKEIIYYDELVKTYSTEEDIVEQFYNNLKATIQRKAENGGSKYIAYLEINPGLECPDVYSSIHGKNAVSMIAKLRTSSHNLRIEMGRRVGLSRDQRLCHCGMDVEHERHFLLECVSYIDIRRRYGIDSISLQRILGNGNYVKYISELFNERKLFVV